MKESGVLADEMPKENAIFAPCKQNET